MEEPVMSRYASYEKAAIMKWFNEGNTTCPVSGQPITPSGLVTNAKLQREIDAWVKKTSKETGQKFEFGHHKEEVPIFVAMASLPPRHFFCPLSHKMMTDPVMTRDGLNFERKVIMEALEQNSCVCPVTGKMLYPHELISNCKLEREIEQWRRSHEMSVSHPAVEPTAVFFESLLHDEDEIPDVADSEKPKLENGKMEEEVKEEESCKKEDHHFFGERFRNMFLKKGSPKMQQNVAKSA
jgi:hypothetical protein